MVLDADAPLSWAAIALGGALGALVRGGLLMGATAFESARARSRASAAAILVANLGACWLLGHLLAASDPSGSSVPRWPGEPGLAFATTGLCGSLSTFSTICADLAQTLRTRRLRLGATYLLAHLVGGPAALVLGATLTR